MAHSGEVVYLIAVRKERRRADSKLLAAMSTEQPTRDGKPTPLLLIVWCCPGTLTFPVVGSWSCALPVGP